MTPKTSLKIVIVDDDHTTCELMRAILRNNGHDVVGETGSGASALALCKSERPNVVLLDIHLRDANGLELLERIVREYPQTSVVMLSSDTFPEVVKEAAAKGARGFIGKPFSGEAVMKTIEHALRPAG